MYRVCLLRLGLNFGVRLTADKNFYMRLFYYRLRKCMRLRFSLRNVYGHTVVVAPILRLRLIVETKKLKYKLKPSKHMSLESKSTLQ